MNNRDRVIVGLIGGIGSGKTTAAKHLADRYRFVELGIADQLKKICCDLFDLPAERAWGTQAEKAEPLAQLGDRSTRTLLEETAAHFRKFNENVWLDYAFRGCDAHRVAMPDVRYTNEWRWIKERGGVIIRMHVIHETPPNTGHESDLQWRSMPFDFRVNAERGRIDHIHEQLNQILKEIL